MYSAFTLGLKYIGYYLKAKNGRGHGIHSPFVFNFVSEVLNDGGAYYCYGPIESARTQYLQNFNTITVQDFGAGSRTAATKRRSIGSIAATALKPKKYGQLLFRMANHYQCRHIMELGTSLGITTSYLAAASAAASVVTMEGAPEVAALAQAHFKGMALKNVTLLQGNFDETLPQALRQMPLPDLVYVDGNHRKAPTLRYFQALLPTVQDHTIVVFDDIHWSEDMEAAWESIKADEAVTLSIDLFFIGIVFFSRNFKAKQHFTIRF
jgi:predicted O-methyltransferase YrrM